MKKLNYFVMIILGLICLVFVSCIDEEIEIESVVIGKAIATPSIVKNGEEVMLSIDGTISSSSTLMINGKEYYPIIHYFIDKREVAVSDEKRIPFKAICIINDCTVGEHELSVVITPSDKGATYENKVATSKITVKE